MRVLSEYEEHRLKANISEGKWICLAKAVFSLEVLTRLWKNLQS